MYMSQHRFTPVPEKFEQWLPYNWNYMTLTARAPGAVLSRILRLTDHPGEFLAIGVWTDRESAVRWSESAESRLAAQPAIDQGLYDGYPIKWTRWDLIDFAWGLEGASLEEDPDFFTRHITLDRDPEQGEMQEMLCRAALSLLARRPGFVSGETYRGHKSDRLLLVHTYRTRDAWPFAGDALPEEFALLGATDAARTLGDGLAGAETLNCTSHQFVWGPARAAMGDYLTAQAA